MNPVAKTDKGTLVWVDMQLHIKIQSKTVGSFKIFGHSDNLFYMTIWLGHGEHRNLSEHYCECVCKGISDELDIGISRLSKQITLPDVGVPHPVKDSDRTKTLNER